MQDTVILPQEEDEGRVVTAPVLPGCVSQGDSRDEALANIREALEVYLEECREAGAPIPSEVGREYVDLEVRV